MYKKSDITTLASYCKSTLDLGKLKQADEYYYHSLPHCVVDAVFSIGVRYTGVQKTVRRYCEYFNLPLYSRHRLPESEQISISKFLEWIQDCSAEDLAINVFNNQQRTSSRSGILKAEAVVLFAQVLKSLKVDFLQDVPRIIGDERFETRIAQIPGQRSRLSTKYFYMLAGSDDFIKPDRMIRRFVFSALHREIDLEDYQDVITEACRMLQKEYPDLTPRLLDYQIWLYQQDH